MSQLHITTIMRIILGTPSHGNNISSSSGWPLNRDFIFDESINFKMFVPEQVFRNRYLNIIIFEMSKVTVFAV